MVAVLSITPSSDKSFLGFSALCGRLGQAQAGSQREGPGLALRGLVLWARHAGGGGEWDRPCGGDTGLGDAQPQDTQLDGAWGLAALAKPWNHLGLLLALLME